MVVVAIIGDFPSLLQHMEQNSATGKENGVGWSRHTGAQRCTGSRRPDHARGSLFVRTCRNARMLPRRTILVCTGALGGSHQQSHMHSWLRTMFGHRRPRAEQVGRQHWRGDFRATSDTRVHLKVAFAAVGPPRSRSTVIPFACTVPGPALPFLTCPTRPKEPRLRLAGLRALSLRRVQRPLGPPARSPSLARDVCLDFPSASLFPRWIRLLCFWLGLLSVCFRSVSLVSRPLVPSRSQRPLDPPGRPRMRSLCAGPYAGYPMVLVCNRHACGSCSVLSPSRFVSDVSTRTRRSLTSPRNLHTPHTPHHIHSSYTTIPTNLSTLPLVLVQTSLGWCTVYCMPWMHFVLIDHV